MFRKSILSLLIAGSIVTSVQGKESENPCDTTTVGGWIIGTPVLNWVTMPFLITVKKERRQKEYERQVKRDYWVKGMILKFRNEMDRPYRFVYGDNQACVDALHLPHFNKTIQGVCWDVLVQPNQLKELYLPVPASKKREPWVIYWPVHHYNPRSKDPLNAAPPNPFKTANPFNRAIVRTLGGEVPVNDSIAKCVLQKTETWQHADGRPTDSILFCKADKILTKADHTPIEPLEHGECASTECCHDKTFYEWRVWYDNGGRH